VLFGAGLIISLRLLLQDEKKGKKVYKNELNDIEGKTRNCKRRPNRL